MKICIAGKNSIAVNAVDHLINLIDKGDHEIVVLPNNDDLGYDDWQPSLSKYASNNDLNIVDINELYYLNDLIFISLEYNRIIDPNKFQTEKLFNIHFSYLPSYKGMYTSIHPIINGEKKSGVTLHLIDSGIDAGEIIDCIQFPLEIDDTARDLYFKYLDYGFKIFKNNIISIINNTYNSTSQSNLYASYYSKKSIDFNNIKIDLNKTAYEIHNQIRAYNFKEYQLPKIMNKFISKSVLTNEKKEYEKIVEFDDRFEIVGIDKYVVQTYKAKQSI